MSANPEIPSVPGKMFLVTYTGHDGREYAVTHFGTVYGWYSGQVSNIPCLSHRGNDWRGYITKTPLDDSHFAPDRALIERAWQDAIADARAYLATREQGQ
jgi:hypothetical protein